MSKWVIDTFEGTKVWYSDDVIEKIKKIATRISQDYDGNQADRMVEDADKILNIIESEEV